MSDICTKLNTNRVCTSVFFLSVKHAKATFCGKINKEFNREIEIISILACTENKP